jgi:hypothetical protein
MEPTFLSLAVRFFFPIAAQARVASAAGLNTPDRSRGGTSAKAATVMPLHPGEGLEG